jgi:transcriptional regulator with GAF, ATPase, and Fis domain
MPEARPHPLRDLDEDEALRSIAEGTAADVGAGFFRSLVENLSRALGTQGAWVTEYFPQARRMRALAFFLAGRWIEDYEFEIAGTPCEAVIDSAGLVHVPDRLLEIYPGDPDIRKIGAVSYMGLPFVDEDGTVLGHLAVVDDRQMPGQPRALAIFRIFAARAAAELRRLRAERRVRSLSAETECLREEIRALHDFDEIIGGSEALLRLLRDVEQVAETDATVLVLGETGTGKELVARAIHARSRRRDRALVSVNCAAIPESLVESELFGHEKGAFTGATARREGRFSMADGGTIFLDEVGELPLHLQAKLLRVVQHSEFEPVGSSTTRRVDVRVIAATNRDLLQASRAGTFREDLYYRLNVFPLRVPPLRERIEDVTLLAAAFAERYARRAGRRVEPLSESDLSRLRSYAWPGNVRELQNVIERAVIIARDGRLDLDRALPEEARTAAPRDPPRAPGSGGAPAIRTAQELEALEKENYLRALDVSGWKVAGDGGAAARLGMKPSTLSSRMKALGISRPRPAGL